MGWGLRVASVVAVTTDNPPHQGPPGQPTPSTQPTGQATGHEGQRTLRSGGAALLPRDVVVVAGPDAETFLQGQLSADLGTLAPEEGTWSLLCDPSGRVTAWLRVSRADSDTFVLDVDEGFATVVADRLNRFLLRTKATISVEPPGEWVCLAVRGPRQVELDHAAGSSVMALPTPWPGMVGFDVLARSSAHVRLDAPMVDTTALDALRVECGAPAMGRELDGTTIAAEVGQWFVDASVSFTKGCFVGQELVARIDSRGGNVPRRLRGIIADTMLTAGDELVGGDAVVGVVTSVADTATVGPMGLGWVKRAVEPGSVVTVRSAGGDTCQATVVEVPVVDDTEGPGGPGSEVPVDLGS